MHLAEPWLRSAHRHGDAEHRIAPVVLHGERDVAQRVGGFSAVAPPSAGETSSWLVHSSSMS
jgi:hypothetical protein